jgi:ubiquinone/menaquinone biosynthesis C-methylase UbiE
MRGVDHKADLLDLPFNDGSYDIVFASHVLEHIRDDKKAVAEIRRILKPNGIAILPVPVVCAETIEYPEANPHEAGHVRAPGLDYFERYREHFSRVTIASSEAYPEKYQLYIYEDRSRWPTRECPMRRPMQGKKHADYVPVCYV